MTAPRLKNLQGASCKSPQIAIWCAFQAENGWKRAPVLAFY